MVILTLKGANGRKFWIDDANYTEVKGRAIFTYVRKDGSEEKHDIDKAEIADKQIEDLSVADFFAQMKNKEE